jgi:PAS domain-containing protein
METGVDVDIDCHGGLRIFAVPIRAGNEIVGSINFGYGKPPKRKDLLRSIAEKYEVPAEELFKLATTFRSHPATIIKSAKKRLITAARLIGAIVEQKRTAEAIQRNHAMLGRRVEYQVAELSTVKERLRLLYENAPAMIHSINRHGYITDVTDFWLETMGFQRDEVLGRHITEFLTEESSRQATESDLPDLLNKGFSKNI